MVVAEQAPEPLPARHGGAWRSRRLRRDQPVPEPLVISLAVTVGHELRQGPVQVGLPGLWAQSCGGQRRWLASPTGALKLQLRVTAQYWSSTR